MVFLHGGPGGGSLPAHRRLFDPAAYRIVLLDQRGCGRSRPHASEQAADLSANTTWHLVADLERLRAHLRIDRWQVFGGSWGSALALAYAEEHSDRVTELVVRGIFTLRRSELDFYYNGGAGQLFPERYAQFLGPLGGPDFTGDAIAAYAELLADPDPAVHGPAAVAWSSWEAATITLETDDALVAAFSEPAYALAFARIENHYFVHGGWFAEGQLIAACRPTGRYPRCHRAGPLRRRHSGGHGLRPASGLAAGRLRRGPAGRPRLLRARHRRGPGRRHGSLCRAAALGWAQQSPHLRGTAE